MVNSVIRVAMTMSGGVDSSVAAALLKEQGYAVTGVTMKIWGGKAAAEAPVHHGCYGPGEEEDIEDAGRVAQQLDIPFHVLDLTREYRSEVLDYFSREYLSGRTPNPCVRCNHNIKFGALIEKSRQSGLQFDAIASGHYARVEYDAQQSRYILKKAKDLTKDQSYFLSFLSQKQLAQLMLPLGGYTKTEVRAMAKRFGLHIAAKPDSQNFICGDYTSLIQDRTHTWDRFWTNQAIYWVGIKESSFIPSGSAKAWDYQCKCRYTSPQLTQPEIPWP